MDTSTPATGTQVDIGWVEAREANLLNWDDRAALHEQSYGLEAFLDPSHVSGQARGDLAVMAPFLGPDGIAGKRLLHLQCHIGTDTVSWARLGARVTGLDFSGASLEVARRLADTTGVDVEWVQSDVLAARDAVHGEFDVV